MIKRQRANIIAFFSADGSCPTTQHLRHTEAFVGETLGALAYFGVARDEGFSENTHVTGLEI